MPSAFLHAASSNDAVIRPHRRQWIHGLTAAGISGYLSALVAAAAQASPTNRPRVPLRRCVTLWMQGGPSQLDTFDPKPGTATGGPLQSVATSVPGLHFCETLSSLATRADDLCMIRSVGSRQGEHDRATHLLHTGYEQIDSFPRPSLGAFVSSTGMTNASNDNGIPRSVTLGDQVFSPAFLGIEHGPFVISDLVQARQTIAKVKKNASRMELIGQLNQSGAGEFNTHALRQRAEQIDSIARLVKSPFAESMDVSLEQAATRQRYGDSDFGRNVLAARRMLESGVRYVEVQMPGWDTHVGNFSSVKRLCQQIEPAWIALMDDLKSSGLWDDTLILWMGEFGRTPAINGQQGRDHYPQSIPVTLAGKQIGGRVIGSTGPQGQDPSEHPNSVADLMYTLMNLLGVDADRRYTTDFASPTSATDNGELIAGLIDN